MGSGVDYVASDRSEPITRTSVCFRSLHNMLHFYSNAVSLLQVYKAINTYVALIGLEIWTDGDKCLLSRAAGSTLDNFSKWRLSDLLKRKRNDNAQLITCVLFCFLFAFPNRFKEFVLLKLVTNQSETLSILNWISCVPVPGCTNSGTKMQALFSCFYFLRGIQFPARTQHLIFLSEPLQKQAT